MTRLEANREIVKILSEQVENNPDMRFYQLLNSLDNIIQSPKDAFYEESKDTLEHIKKSL
jgi:predicted transcriptional regulator